MNKHDNVFLDEYFESYRHALEINVRPQILAFRDLCKRVQSENRKLILAGNGASAAIAGHLALDFTKQAKVRAVSFNDPALITAFSNDYGQDLWIAKAIEHYGDPGDAVVLISSSGRSPNIVSAAEHSKAMNLPIVTFTGFGAENPLKSKGDINFYIPSKAYQIIECTHMIWITIVVDLLIGQSEYGV